MGPASVYSDIPAGPAKLVVDEPPSPITTAEHGALREVTLDRDYDERHAIKGDVVLVEDREPVNEREWILDGGGIVVELKRRIR